MKAEGPEMSFNFFLPQLSDNWIALDNWKIKRIIPAEVAGNYYWTIIHKQPKKEGDWRNGYLLSIGALKQSVQQIEKSFIDMLPRNLIWNILNIWKWIPYYIIKTNKIQNMYQLWTRKYIHIRKNWGSNPWKPNYYCFSGVKTRW